MTSVVLCTRGRSFPRRLAVAISLSLLALQPQPAIAGRVGGGGSHTIMPGDPIEGWIVINDSTLIVGPGAETEEIEAQSQSHIELDGATANVSAGNTLGAVRLVNASATITGSRITSSGGDGFVATVDVNDPIRSMAAVTGSHIEGLGRGALVVGSNVTFSGTAIIGHDTIPSSGGGGLQLNAGSAEVLAGSVIKGDVTGVRMWQADVSHPSQSPSLFIDGSRIESGTGSAIVVESLSSDASRSDIILRNGSGR